VGSAALVPALGLLPVLSAIDYQAVQPSLKGGFKTKLPKRARQFNTGLLGDIFGIGFYPTPFHGAAKHQVVVRFDQARKRLPVASLRRFD